MPGSDNLDQLLELYRQEQDRELARRRALDNRLDRKIETKAERNGYTGPLCESLTIDRRHWPTIHQAVISDGVPIHTVRSGKHDDPRIITLRTTTSGALRLHHAITGRP